MLLLFWKWKNCLPFMCCHLYNRWIHQRCCQSTKIWHNFWWQHWRNVHFQEIDLLTWICMKLLISISNKSILPILQILFSFFRNSFAVWMKVFVCKSAEIPKFQLWFQLEKYFIQNTKGSKTLWSQNQIYKMINTQYRENPSGSHTCKNVWKSI